MPKFQVSFVMDDYIFVCDSFKVNSVTSQYFKLEGENSCMNTVFVYKLLITLQHLSFWWTFYNKLCTTFQIGNSKVSIMTILFKVRPITQDSNMKEHAIKNTRIAFSDTFEGEVLQPSRNLR